MTITETTTTLGGKCDQPTSGLDGWLINHLFTSHYLEVKIEIWKFLIGAVRGYTVDDRDINAFVLGYRIINEKGQPEI